MHLGVAFARSFSVISGYLFLALKTFLNPQSLVVLNGCRLEPGLARAKQGNFFQFERLGYFCIDPDSAAGHLVFNRIVTLKDELAKIEKKGAAGKTVR